jgi:hypothetical protein
MASGMSPHLVPIQLGTVRCKCYEPELDARLVDLLSREDLRMMHRFHDEHVPQLPWWGSVTLWYFGLCVVGLVVLLVVLPQKLMVWPAPLLMGALQGVPLLIDGAVNEWHTQKKAPAVIALLQELSREWRTRRGFQLLYCRLKSGTAFAVELGPRLREPMDEVSLLGSVAKNARYATEYSLAVEELCGAEYAERQFARDVDQLNQVPGPRLASLGLVLNMAAPLTVITLYFAFLLLLESVAPVAAKTAVSAPVIVALFVCSLGTLPLGSLFRRRESNRFVRDMATAVEQLQSAGDWRWLFVGPDTIFEQDVLLNGWSASSVRSAKRMLFVLDLLLHTGPHYSVRIVSAQRARRDGITEIDTLL